MCVCVCGKGNGGGGRRIWVGGCGGVGRGGVGEGGSGGMGEACVDVLSIHVLTLALAKSLATYNDTFQPLVEALMAETSKLTRMHLARNS